MCFTGLVKFSTFSALLHSKNRKYVTGNNVVKLPFSRTPVQFSRHWTETRTKGAYFHYSTKIRRSIKQKIFSNTYLLNDICHLFPHLWVPGVASHLSPVAYCFILKWLSQHCFSMKQVLEQDWNIYSSIYLQLNAFFFCLILITAKVKYLMKK